MVTIMEIGLIIYWSTTNHQNIIFLLLEREMSNSSPTNYSYLKPKTYPLSITNNYFCVSGNSCCNRLPKSNHQEYGSEMNPLYLGERDVFW